MALEEHREQLVERFGVLFDELGQPPMEGRVLGYLILSNAPHVSSQQLKDDLGASAGSISSATRALSAAGFIRRVFEKGSRSHYFRAEEDVWGNFLATEHRYLARKKRFAEDLLTLAGPEDRGPRKRLQNMRDYFEWLEGHHQTMYRIWEDVKKKRDAAAHDPGPAVD